MPYQIHRLLTPLRNVVAPPNRSASPVALNDATPLTIAGNIVTERGTEPVLWRLKGEVFLPTPLPPGPFVAGSARVTGLADPDGHALQGVVAGIGLTPQEQYRGFFHKLRVGRTVGGRTVYRDVGPTPLPTLIQLITGELGEMQSSGSAQALAIASSGSGIPYVAGMSDSANGSQRATLWAGLAFVNDLGTLGGNVSWADAVSTDGDVAGWSQLSSGLTHAAYFRRIGHYGPMMIDLGTLGGPSSAVTAASVGFNLHAALHLVGQADDATGVVRACRFSRTPTPAAHLIPGAAQGPGVALAVNRLGVAVGRIALGGREVAFIQTPGSPLVDLNTLVPDHVREPGGARGKPPIHLHEARSINNRGEIVAVGTAGDRAAGFVLVPSTG